MDKKQVKGEGGQGTKVQRKKGIRRKNAMENEKGNKKINKGQREECPETKTKTKTKKADSR